MILRILVLPFQPSYLVATIDTIIYNTHIVASMACYFSNGYMQTSTKSDFFYEEPSFFCVQVEISPMHIEYMTYMRGMDVADQM